ncbi:MAG: aldehyde dehydrogenase family protein [Alphaproteobacteria bacterium]|nr:aldehyde dehydrogenase family protein [Alphaproteobacteria bacterium]
MATNLKAKEADTSSELLELVRSKVALKARYGNWINGTDTAPVSGAYFENLSPITGKVYCQVARSTAQDVEKALDAAHAAFPAWSSITPVARAAILNKIADRMEENLETLAWAESWDKGKPLREAMAADIPMAIDHFRYFAACCRTEEGALSQIDSDTVAYHFHEPLGVIAAIIPWNFPMVLTAWKMAPALAAGNSIIIKPAEQTPLSIMVFMELIADLLPPGVVNVVHGFGPEAGAPLAQSPRVNKVTFTGETSTGKLIMQYASHNIVPVTLELGGKSPNIFFPDLFDADDDLLDKALEGFTMFALNQGEVCTCPSRALVHEKIYDRFMERALARVKKITVGNPLELSTMMGAQASKQQLDKILSYVEIGKGEGAKLLSGGSRAALKGELAEGYFMTPTVFEGSNSMRIFREEIFGPVVSVTPFKDYDDAMRIANDTDFGLTAGVWTRDINTAYRAGRAVKAGRIWVNAYHLYPAHAAFGGYKQSGIGRENHKMMLSHFQQTKNMLVSYNPKAMGFF